MRHCLSVHEHRNSDSLEKVEALPGCSRARNHNSHANMHACCTFVRGSLATPPRAQNRKLQKGTGDGFLQAWPCGWHVLGEHSRSMVERAHRAAKQLDVPLFCLQAADQRHARKNKTIDKQMTD